MNLAMSAGEYRWPDTQTLAQLLETVPVLGIRRLIRITRQVAVELHLATRAGVSPGPITLDCIVLEYPGTPCEQALLQHGDTARASVNSDTGLEALGALVLQVLMTRSVVLESSLEGAHLSGKGGAANAADDPRLLHSLRRALRLIAERCLQGPAAYYASPCDVAADLARLARISEGIATGRGARSPRIHVHAPHPRTLLKTCHLPKVIIEGSALSRAERLWRKCAAVLRPSAPAAA
jgi:hypothetical protein